jgi:hypothetical protein
MRCLLGPSIVACLAAACSSGHAVPAPPTSDAGSDADPRCQIQPRLLGVHPHAALQATDVGKDIVDVRGWRGQVYCAYGDLAANTGPIFLTTWDPGAKTWREHPVSFLDTTSNTWQQQAAFDTERIERFVPIGDSLWAPAADPRSDRDPEYAIGAADHTWKQVHIGVAAHVFDAFERVPGEVLLTGSGLNDPAGTEYGGAVWRSVGGAPFEKTFPRPDPVPNPDQTHYIDHTGYPFVGAVLGGTAYLVNIGPGWTFDGQTFGFGLILGQFTRPATFSGRIVSSDLSELYSFDGKKVTTLGVRLVDVPATNQFTGVPLAIFQSTEGRLLAVRANGDVVMTTDLDRWDCIGKAPGDVRSIGSLDGVVYFGGALGRVYSYDQPTW